MIYYLVSPDVTFTEAQIQGEISLTKSCNAGDDLTLGSCIASKIEFTVLDLPLSITNIHHTEFQYYIEKTEDLYFANGDALILQNGERVQIKAGTEYKGYFRADKPERIDESKWKITCYDRMVLFDKIADEYFGNLEYPIRLKDLLIGLCEYCGIKLATEVFTNSDFMVQKNVQAENIKGRDILSWICEIAACFAKINADGNLELAFYQQSNIKINQMISSKVGDYQVLKIDKLQIKSKTDDIGVIVGTGTNAYVIESNPLLFANSDAEIRPVAENIFQKIKDMTYVPLELQAFISDSECDIGDIIEVTTRRGTYTTCVMNIISTGIKTTIKSTGSENRSKLQSVNRIIQQLRGKSNEIIADIEKFSVTLTEAKNETDKNSAQLLIQAGEIGLKANQTTVDSLSGRVGSTEASIIIQAGQISSKVSQTDYNGNTIASLINQTDTTIRLQAQKLELDGYTTITELATGNLTVSGKFITQSGGKSVEINEGKVRFFEGTKETGSLQAGADVTSGPVLYGIKCDGAFDTKTMIATNYYAGMQIGRSGTFTIYSNSEQTRGTILSFSSGLLVGVSYI